ncbi:amidohydrolase family protein [Paracoccus marinaquae]|uniref:Amidohydrolase family protein n=1 Tax=Paracoccus marinaquae TaxID=2841926 RepID=A0ABS6AN80_9RHOB|nr:amidohydrolase family protein [Paracoccus marinaquae]MBU3031075.1 amidohydrolase family protein [Paracoccus marinaquae]
MNRAETAKRAQAIGNITDCHVHVFEDRNRYPMPIKPAYEPPFAPVSSLLERAARASVSRFVLVQPTPYADDLSLLEASLATLRGRARGVGVAGKSTSPEALSRITWAGIVALRFVETRLPNGERMPGTVPMSDLEGGFGALLREFGMHAEIWGPLADILAQWPVIERTKIPVVLDHMAGFNVEAGREHKDFQRLLAMLRDGAVWVKLAICRRVAGTDYDVLRPFHDDLVEANSERLIWATDNPFVRYPGTPPTVEGLLQQFLDWVPDEALARRILVENPARLYRFPGPSGLTG